MEEQQTNLLFIHKFWQQMCPFFEGYDLIYIILDIVTIIAFFKFLFAIPRLVMGGYRK